MKVAAEIHLSSTLCLFSDDDRHTLTDPQGRFVIEVSNNPAAGPFTKRALKLEMVFGATSLDSASEEALEHLMPLLNALAFTTSASFSDPIVVRIFDWTPGLIKREARYYAAPQATMTTRALQGDLFDTAVRVLAMHSDEISGSAMRWYRFGLLADGIEEQFSYLWFCVEIVADALKAAGKIAPRCPQCNADLYCPACNATPTRRRFATEAIEDLICAVAPEGADTAELVKTLFKIRNTLQHGRRLASIADKLPCTEDQAVNVLARIARRGIMKLADQASDPSTGAIATFVQVDDVVNRTLTAGIQVWTQLTGGDPQNPQMKFAPKIEMSMGVDGKSYTFDGIPIDGARKNPSRSQ